jgi:hypothetical protein
MKLILEIDLDDAYADEFLPIYNQPILKIIRDIKRAQNIIIEKVAEDIRTSELFRNFTYQQLQEEIEAWSNRDRLEHKEMFDDEPR